MAEDAGNIATCRMTHGAQLGNGSAGVAIGGTPDKQQFYIGRNDFWSVLRGSILPDSRVQLSLRSRAHPCTSPNWLRTDKVRRKYILRESRH